MKKILTIASCILLALALGCAQKQGADRGERPNGVKDLLASAAPLPTAAYTSPVDNSTQKPASDNPTQKPASDNSTQKPAADSMEADIDLTVISGNMVYAEVFNLTNEPEKHKGKIVKMQGSFSEFYSSETNKRYFSCIITDASACCASGLEFVLTDDYVYPDDYPSKDETITVIGVFDSYVEDGNTYYTLRDAKLL